MKKRIEWIDLCKIITMIIVCYDHTIQSIAPDEALKNSFFIGTISFHMPLFMILSGYFINPKRMRTDKITTSCFSKFKHLIIIRKSKNPAKPKRKVQNPAKIRRNHNSKRLLKYKSRNIGMIKKSIGSQANPMFFFAYRSRNIIKHYVHVMGIIVH